MLQVPGPVTFTRGRMTGSGTGATYDRNRDVLWLLADAQITVTPDRDRVAGRMQGTAGTAGLARADHYVRLSKTAHVVADNRTIDADDLTADADPGRSEGPADAAPRQQPHRRHRRRRPERCRRRTST